MAYKERDRIMSEYFANSPELAEGADIRIFSFNVLFNTQIKEPTPAERSVALRELLGHFTPDVIGLQEINADWQEAFKGANNGIYRLVDDKNELGQWNYTPLAYNENKVRVIEHGTKIYEKAGNTKIRIASWACFEKLDDGKRFVAVNTHWDITKFVENVIFQAEEMAGIVLELGKKYDCPVITTGDYNRKEDSEEYKRFIELTGYHEAKYTAAVIERAHSTFHKPFPLGMMPNIEVKESIDHIFGSPDAEFLFFTILVDQIVLDNSDHCPIYADIKLN